MDWRRGPTVVQFGDVDYAVCVKVHRLPKCGGWWALFLCPRCGHGAQRLRLLDDAPACGACVRASGLIFRSQSVRTEKRHLVAAPPRLARLNCNGPLRAHARPRRTFDRHANLEIVLRRSLIVARQFAIDEDDKMRKDHYRPGVPATVASLDHPYLSAPLRTHHRMKQRWLV